jgi:hypothetical protein
MTDLLDLAPKTDTIVVTIKHPVSKDVLKNSDGSDMTITVFAPYSKEYKRVAYEIANKRLKTAQEKGTKEFSVEDFEQASLDSMAMTTKEWNITYGGELPELTVGKAKEVYDKVFWIKSQVDEAMESSLSFMTT